MLGSLRFPLLQENQDHPSQTNNPQQRTSPPKMSPPPPSPSPSAEAELIVKNRFLGFLIWQSLPSLLIYILFKSLFFSFSFSFLSFLSFLISLLSQLLFSIALSFTSCPLPLPLLPSFYSLRSLPSSSLPLFLFLFLIASAFSGLLSTLSFSGLDGIHLIRRSSFRGYTLGFLYALFFIYHRRWVLEFPIVQRPPFFSFKMGIPLAVRRAFKLSTMAYVFSSVLMLFLPDQFKSKGPMGKFITEQIVHYLGSCCLFLCWELCHHLHQVLHTKRFTFAPPKGSAAAETNPSEPLLAALEESTPNSLLQYLAYLDLCMVCEYNVDTWRRAAFFEETGETYRRVVAACLRPLDKLSSNIAEGFEGGSFDKALLASNQLQSPSDSQLDAKYCELVKNFQLCAWGARAASSLTALSHKEDRLGVAQLTGSNAAIVSTLVSSLLAVEALMGKKTNLQPQHQLTGPAGIKWATSNTGRRDVVMAKRRGGPLHSKAYAMADVLSASIYCVVSAFHDEMLTSAKSGLLEKDWIIKGKPLFGSHELLVQKLRTFLDFRAS